MILTKDQIDLLVGILAPHADGDEVRKNPSEYLSKILSGIMNYRRDFTVRGIAFSAAQEAAREVIRKNSLRKKQETARKRSLP